MCIRDSLYVLPYLRICTATCIIFSHCLSVDNMGLRVSTIIRTYSLPEAWNGRENIRCSFTPDSITAKSLWSCSRIPFQVSWLLFHRLDLAFLWMLAYTRIGPISTDFGSGMDVITRGLQTGNVQVRYRMLACCKQEKISVSSSIMEWRSSSIRSTSEHS